MTQIYRTHDFLPDPSEFEAKHAPEALFLAGDGSFLTKGRRVAVVGSRKPSGEGLARARVLTKALVDHEITVVSGLATGIDTVAHQTAIEFGGATIAVLGTPLSQAYPAENARLLEEIKKDHLAISQFQEGHPLKRDNFPRRNRTMALISDATIIVEAGESSGTRHQGWEAIRLGRLLYVMQNLVDDPKLNWPKEMIGYGAQALRREDMPDVLHDIPNFTSGGVCAV